VKEGKSYPYMKRKHITSLTGKKKIKVCENTDHNPTRDGREAFIRLKN